MFLAPGRLLERSALDWHASRFTTWLRERQALSGPLKTEQIVSYLLVTTVITIFAVLVLYTMMSSIGNGGEYWGYDGRKEPRNAARESMLAGDYRFLDVNLPPYENRLTSLLPGLTGCTNYVIDQLSVLHSSDEPLHAEDSLKLAMSFGGAYNREIAWELNRDRDAGCQVLWSYY